MRWAYIIMVCPKSKKLLFVKAFIMIAFTTSNTTIAFQFCWFRIDSIAAIAIVTWATEKFCYICNIFHCFPCMVWKFSTKLISKKALEMVKFIAFSWGRATIYICLISFSRFLFSLFTSPSSTIVFIFNINSYIKAYWTLKFIDFIFTIMALWLINSLLFPLF